MLPLPAPCVLPTSSRPGCLLAQAGHPPCSLHFLAPLAGLPAALCLLACHTLLPSCPPLIFSKFVLHQPRTHHPNLSPALAPASDFILGVFLHACCTPAVVREEAESSFGTLCERHAWCGVWLWLLLARSGGIWGEREERGTRQERAKAEGGSKRDGQNKQRGALGGGRAKAQTNRQGGCGDEGW